MRLDWISLQVISWISTGRKKYDGDRQTSHLLLDLGKLALKLVQPRVDCSDLMFCSYSMRAEGLWRRSSWGVGWDWGEV
jgi:hypothetical protein